MTICDRRSAAGEFAGAGLRFRAAAAEWGVEISVAFLLARR